MFDRLAKEKFEEWFKKVLPHWDMDSNWGEIGFLHLTPSMQWGVIQEFSDSLGYSMHTELTHLREEHFYLIEKINSKTAEWVSDTIGTRQEARTEAIKKLNELINNN